MKQKVTKISPLSEIGVSNLKQTKVSSQVPLSKAVADSPVGQVLAGPLFLKVKTNSILQKASNKQKQ